MIIAGTLAAYRQGIRIELLVCCLLNFFKGPGQWKVYSSAIPSTLARSLLSLSRTLRE